MKILKNLLSSDYGMLGVLVLLCVFFSVITYEEQQPLGKDGAERLFAKISNDFEESGTVIIAGKNSNDGQKFVLHLENELKRTGWEVAAAISGSPVDIGKALRRTVEKKEKVDVFACEQTLAGLPVVVNLKKNNPLLKEMKVLSPKSYGWPNFLKTSNLLNVANQIAVIAIIAIGMTLVIITAGIDLSVGSLIAFSAVLCCWFMKELMGGPDASVMGMIIAALFAVLGCGILGLFSGSMVAYFGVPSFVASLGMMMVASGFAYMISGGLSIYQIPPAFDWLGRGEAFWGIPNAVVLMVLLYLFAQFVMSRTTAGRYIYAVGGNPEAARLSGVPVKKILLWVYTVSGALAGLGGVVMASQFRSGDPKYGLMYELYVIAAVVVGGTSLAGGRGKVFGTLIGAFIIAVIQNGMNLTGVQSYTQKVVLGIVLLSAVLLDMIKKKGWKLSS
ncbi:MAG: ABC transporter permease [Verrucomicrobiota bacterium]|nr:ABC transporter permease [Verrucomicrobiota bacterium]